MSHINLLPWRDEDKKKRKTAFLILLAVSCLGALALSYAGKIYVDSMIEAQNQRNQFLQTQTIILDRRIAEIRSIKAEKAELVRRIDLIHELESKRNTATRLFNAMLEVTPPGVYVSSINFNAGKVAINGLTESNGRVSNMLRNVDNSGWLGYASLPSIVAGPSAPIKLFKFSMNFIVLPKEEQKL